MREAELTHVSEGARIVSRHRSPSFPTFPEAFQDNNEESKENRMGYAFSQANVVSVVATR